MFKHFFFSFLGFVIAMLCIMAIQVTSRKIWPPPEGPAGTNDREALRAMVDSMPTGALVSVAFMFVAGTFVGGTLASKLSGSGIPAYAVGGFVLIGVVASITAIPYPPWFWIAEFVLVPASAWLAAKIGAPARTPAA